MNEELNYVEIKPKRCTECGEDYTPIIHSDECPHNKVGVSEQKRLDRPELREKIEEFVGKYNRWRSTWSGERFTMSMLLDQILALIPDIEEAKKQERERIIKDLGELHRPDYRVKDVIVYLKYRFGIKQALKEEK